jgi:hypothetical protein
VGVFGHIASCCSASRLGEASAHCPLAVWPSDSRIPAKGPVSNGTGATHSPADASVPVAVAVPITGPIRGVQAREHLPIRGHLRLYALPQRHRRQTGSSHALSVARDDDNPQPLSDSLFVRTRLAAGSLSGRLERLLSGFLQPGRIIDAASPESHSSFGGSSSPSRAPLLAFPTRLTLYCDTTVLSRRSRYSRLSLFPFRDILECEPRATRPSTPADSVLMHETELSMISRRTLENEIEA